jgi:hypothetical protein
MKTLVKTFFAAALIAVSTFAMAAEGPGSKLEKTNVNLSTADFALEHYIAVTTEGESVGVEQLFAEDFNQKIQTSNAQSNSRNEVVKSLKKQKGRETKLYSKHRHYRRVGRLYGSQSNFEI